MSLDWMHPFRSSLEGHQHINWTLYVWLIQCVQQFDYYFQYTMFYQYALVYNSSISITYTHNFRPKIWSFHKTKVAEILNLIIDSVDLHSRLAIHITA